MSGRERKDEPQLPLGLLHVPLVFFGLLAGRLQHLLGAVQLHLQVVHHLPRLRAQRPLVRHLLVLQPKECVRSPSFCPTHLLHEQPLDLVELAEVLADGVVLLVDLLAVLFGALAHVGGLALAGVQLALGFATRVLGGEQLGEEEVAVLGRLNGGEECGGRAGAGLTRSSRTAW